MADFNEILYGVPGGMATPVAVPEGVLPPQAAAPQEAAPIMAPQAAQPQAAPPQAPPQQESLGLFERLRSDPLLSQAALMAGIRLAQGPRPGQTALGLVGDAMMVGKTAHDMLQGNVVQEQRAGETHQANMARSAAQTEGQQLQNDETRQVMPSRVKALRLKAEALERAGDVEKASQVYEQAKAEFKSFLAKTDTTGMVERAAMDEILMPSLEKRAKINYMNQQAGASAASADAASARAGLYNAQASGQIPTGGSGKGGAASAQIAAAEYLGETLRQQGKSEEEIAAAKIRHLTESKRKGNYAEFLQWVGASGVDISTPAKESEAIAAYQASRARMEGGEAPTTAPKTAPGGKTPSLSEPRAAAEARLKATPGAEGYTLGRLTPQGWEVKDSKGKLIGFGQ